MRLSSLRHATSACTLVATLAALACSADAPTGALSVPSDAPRAAAAAGAGRTVQRPITDFIETQGTSCLPVVCIDTPFAAIISWVGDERQAYADYAGVIGRYIESASGGAISLGTSHSGTITERRLADGRAEVHVNLHTTNALAAAVEGTQRTFLPVIFGNDYAAVLQGAAPALADVRLDVKFIVAAPGQPLPDLDQLIFAPTEGQQLLQLKLHATATGELHPPLAEEGTIGRLTFHVVGLNNTGPRSRVANGFPVDLINIKPIGPR